MDISGQVDNNKMRKREEKTNGKKEECKTFTYVQKLCQCYLQAN